MRSGFVADVMGDLLEAGPLTRGSSILAVAGGTAERDLFSGLGFEDVTITNLDDVQAAAHLAPFRWAPQAAQNLSYGDRSFDWVVVVDGLHHCTSPHRALTEMYRVCRVGVVAIEARDSLLMRVAVRLGASERYETQAVRHQGGRSGGLENGPIPNHIYRWTESEFRKTIRSCDPTGEHRFTFRHGLNLPHETAALHPSGTRSRILRIVDPILRLVTWLAPRQRNSLAMIAQRPAAHWPWLEEGEGGLGFRSDG